MIRFALTFAAFVFTSLPLRAEIVIQELTTPNGVPAWLVEEHSLPFTALEIRFRGGTSLDRPTKRGAVNLMAGLLEEGAGDMDARAFAQAREALAASYGFSAYDDAIRVSAQFLTENRDEAVALLHQALTQPRFDQDAVDRVRGQVMSHLSSMSQDPSSIARQTWNGAAFGVHPYGTDDMGTPDSVSQLSRDDILAAFRDAIALDRIYVSAVGDITADELSTLIDSLFDGLPQQGASFASAVEFGAKLGTTVVPFDTPQSVAIFGHAGFARDDPDFFAAFIVNEILGGGGFNSRLMTEVRENRGLTYGIGSYLVPADLSATIIGQFSSQNDKMAQALTVMQDEWQKIASEGITQEELTTAKTYLTGAYPLRFDGNATIANIMVSMQMEALSPEYITTRNDQINAVSLQDANRVAARLYQPDALHVVVVGQPVGLEDE
jgi:zinc protease